MDHDITKLPKWAQEHIASLDQRIVHLRWRITALKSAHAILVKNEREWFVVPNAGEEVYTLWRFFRNQPFAVCSLSDGDLLLVGRAAHKKDDGNRDVN